MSTVKIIFELKSTDGKVRQFVGHDGEDYCSMGAGHVLCVAMAKEIQRLRDLVESSFVEGWIDGNGFVAQPPDEQQESAERCWMQSASKRQVGT